MPEVTTLADALTQIKKEVKIRKGTKAYWYESGAVYLEAFCYVEGTNGRARIETSSGFDPDKPVRVVTKTPWDTDYLYRLVNYTPREKTSFYDENFDF
jgi:hypothetical protein